MNRLVLAILFAVCASAQHATVNTSRSNIKSNIAKIEATPDGKLKCTAVDGKACTAADVRGLETSKIKALAIAEGGVLQCDGKPCTTSHLADINKAVSMRAVATKGVSGSRSAEPPVK